jgi:hypothetical protein
MCGMTTSSRITAKSCCAASSRAASPELASISLTFNPSKREQIGWIVINQEYSGRRFRLAKGQGHSFCFLRCVLTPLRAVTKFRRPNSFQPTIAARCLLASCPSGAFSEQSLRRRNGYGTQKCHHAVQQLSEHIALIVQVGVA